LKENKRKGGESTEKGGKAGYGALSKKGKGVYRHSKKKKDAGGLNHQKKGRINEKSTRMKRGESCPQSG